MRRAHGCTSDAGGGTGFAEELPVKSSRMVVPFAVGAPPGLVTRLYSESMRVLADTEIKKRFDDVGLEAVGMSTEAFVRYVEKDAAEMRGLARKIGLARKN